MNFAPKPGRCGWGHGHGAGPSHLSGDHNSLNINAKEPPSVAPQQLLPNSGTPAQSMRGQSSGCHRLEVGPQNPPVTASPTQAKALHKN